MLPGLLISVISLIVVFYLADIQQVGTAIYRANYILVTVALALTLVWLGVRGIVWRTLLQEKASYSNVFFTLNEGYLLNNILPFRLGEVGRAFLLGRKSGLDFWHVLSSIVIERTLDLALAVGLLFVTLPFVVGASWAREAAMVAAGIVLVGFGVLYLLARYRETALSLFESLSARWPILFKLGGRAFPAFFAGLVVLIDGGRFLRVLAWMAVNWAVSIIQYLILLLAFFPSARLLWATFSLGVVSLGIAAPSFPGAVGVMELSLVGALSLFDLDASVALAFAITAHLFNYLVTGVLGAYALARDGETLLSLFERLRVRR